MGVSWKASVPTKWRGNCTYTWQHTCTPPVKGPIFSCTCPLKNDSANEASRTRAELRDSHALILLESAQPSRESTCVRAASASGSVGHTSRALHK
eukprot:1158344-Pelagomonas_calceolata.AAC.12